MGDKRKFESSFEQNVTKPVDQWMTFRNSALEIKQRHTQQWVDINGVPDQKGPITSVPWQQVISTGVTPNLQSLRLRDPESFMAGGLHPNVHSWEKLLENHPLAEEVSGWIRNKVNVLDFSRPFAGKYKKSSYCSDLPPRKQFSNHISCRSFSSFISQEILNRLMTGSFRLWGVVGVDDPPHLVLPLTVEPSKPRLCLDARFLNLWMMDKPFSLDKLADVPRYIYRSSLMTKCDDKSGYDHILLSDDSQTYFGFCFGGLWFVCRTLPFGWKISAFNHTTGLAVSGFLRTQGIPCSLYIDDRGAAHLKWSFGDTPWG